MIIRPFPALYPDPSKIAAVPAFFDTVKEDFEHFANAAFFKKLDPPAFFLYQIQSSNRLYNGLIAGADLEEYRKGNIKKHEHTIGAEEEKQMHFTLARQVLIKPVLLTYPEDDLIDRWLAQYMAQLPVFWEQTFPAEDRTHRLWAVQAATAIEQLQQLFAERVAHAYIADGHHRMSALNRLCYEQGLPNYSEVLCAFFPSGQLDILEFNRVVALPAGLSLSDFLNQLAHLAEISALSVPAKPMQKHEMTLCTAQGWYVLRWKPATLERFAGDKALLDTQLLNVLALKTFFGITDVRRDHRIAYVEAPQGLEAIQNAVSANPQAVGFCLYPVSFEDLQQIVEAGDTMPPKSTWFEPRMKNGLVIKTYHP